MKLIQQYFLLTFIYCQSINGQYYLYDDDCLDFYATDDISLYSMAAPNYRKEHQIIPYCRRDNFEEEPFVIENDISSFTFDNMYKRKITSLDLYSWSTHLDVVEEYEDFRIKKSHLKINESNLVIYNCFSKHRFGRYCQYSFDSQKPFDAIVKSVLKSNRPLPSNGTCYIDLKCMHNYTPWCLDWRDICDRKVDCWPDPVDEQYCEILEENECDSNEYRCLNGQCIPEVFFSDNVFTPDCLDRTDEVLQNSILYPQMCYQGDPSFRCADTAYPHWSDLNYNDVLYCGGIGSCRDNRIKEFDRALLLPTANTHITDQCWATMICLVQASQLISLGDVSYSHLFNGSCKNVCQEPQLPCTERMIKYCPVLFEFPAMSIGWSQLHFVYSWNRTNKILSLPDYICYDEQRCAVSQYNIHFTKISEPLKILSCQLSNISNFGGDWKSQVTSARNLMHKQCSSMMIIQSKKDCSKTTQFQCGNKCISKHRLLDLLLDCYDRTDETYNDSCSLNDKYRLVCSPGENGVNAARCISSVFLWKGLERPCKATIELPHFPSLCDGYRDYTEEINGLIETDETHCEEWQCDNQYTRCDGIWNCQNGADESDCFHPVCEKKSGHPCWLINTTEFICLPTINANDGKVDCLGATDERYLCKKSDDGGSGYRCLMNKTNEIGMCINHDSVCNTDIDCPLGDDELTALCKNDSNSPGEHGKFWIFYRQITERNLICSLDDISQKLLPGAALQFTLGNYSISYPRVKINKQLSMVSKSELVKNVTEQSRSVIVIKQQTPLIQFQCHSGIPVYYKSTVKCFCPPTLYGSRCEYQSQRVSVTLQIVVPEWRIAFVFVIYLLDNINEIVNSYHQIRYLSIRDCSKKFNFHLLYSSRPKSTNQSYSVRIDMFEMVTLQYRASWSFPILFAFLPVYRLPIQLLVPFWSSSSEANCPLKCQSGHGQCASFVNTNNFFCRCQPGWTGPSCSKPYKCNCSPHSICVGTWKNRSICVCPVHKFGRRCYLQNDVCKQINLIKCSNTSQCIPRDIRIPVDPPMTCSCSYGFHGDTCRQNETRIDILIAMTNIKESLLVHFITVNSHMQSPIYVPMREWGVHERATTFKRIPFDNDEVTIYWPNSFHLIFIEYDHNMYLLFQQLKYKTSAHLKTRLESNLRCPPIRELLNNTIINFPRLRRVKYYHIPCQKRLDIGCFHDEGQYLCLCTYDRRANCFTFNHHLKYDCQQLSYCKNGGQCFQNNAKCPTSALCACPKCYLGTRCELSTRGFGLPLDVILGYQIRQGISFTNQPLSVQISGIITILMFIFGLINGILCIITFKQKSLCEVGCGIYLLIASIISIITISIFTLKYILLILIQINKIKNRDFILNQCITIDFFLKIFLQIGDWLYGCVAIERLISVSKGVYFNKKLSQKMAKWVIFIIFIIVIGTSIQEPLNRTLIDDEDESRIWCVVSYSKSYSSVLHFLTSMTTLIHFIGPVIINIVSAFGIIILTARRRLNLEKYLSFTKHIRKQFRRYKYLIISPIGLIILVLPRIILAFQLECMKSARDSVTLFLIAYFISFLPHLLLFIVFILPSRVYRKVFKEKMIASWKIISRWILCNQIQN